MQQQLQTSTSHYIHEAILFKNRDDKFNALEKYIQKYTLLNYDFVFAIQMADYNAAVEKFKTYNNVYLYNATLLAQAYSLDPAQVPEVFKRHGIPAFEQAFNKNRCLFVYREISDALMSKGFVTQAVDLENICSNYLSTKEAFMLCGYNQANFICKDWKSHFSSLCKTHDCVVTTDQQEELVLNDHAELMLTNLNFMPDSSKIAETFSNDLKNGLALIRLAAQSMDNIISKSKISESEKIQLKRHYGHINIGLEKILEKLQKL